MILLKNCKFIKELTEDYDFDYGDILIKEEIIHRIDREIECSDGVEEVIDLNGQTLLPGLIDLHMHFAQWSYSSCYEALTIDPADIAFKYYAHAMEFAKQGYTTIRDVGSDHRAANALSKAIKEKLIHGPRVISCGLIVTPTETGNDSFRGMYNEADGVDEIKKACREEYKKGAQFIKIMTSGAFMNEGGEPTQPIIDYDELEIAVHISKNKDGYVAAHCHSKEAILMSIKTGVRTIEHGSFIDDECISLLKDSENSFIIPTLSTLIFYDSNDSESGIIKAAQHKLKMKLSTYDNLKKGYENGLKYGWGTDIPLDEWLKRPGYEFMLRKKYLGCSNISLLKQATINSAEIAMVDDVTGSIKAGKKADLISVNGNPVEDITIMYEKPTNVWCAGKRIGSRV